MTTISSKSKSDRRNLDIMGFVKRRLLRGTIKTCFISLKLWSQIWRELLLDSNSSFSGNPVSGLTSGEVLYPFPFLENIIWMYFLRSDGGYPLLSQDTGFPPEMSELESDKNPPPKLWAHNFEKLKNVRAFAHVYKSHIRLSDFALKLMYVKYKL